MGISNKIKDEKDISPNSSTYSYCYDISQVPWLNVDIIAVGNTGIYVIECQSHVAGLI